MTSPTPSTKRQLLGETLETLQAFLKDNGQPAYRAAQILDWIYRKQVREWHLMTNLPAGMRQWLDEQFVLFPSKRVLVKKAGDITEKLLIEESDQRYIETVLIRYPQLGVGADDARSTICVSSQVGCAYGCKFCASGLDGWKRNLSAAEIVAQFLEVSLLEQERGRTRQDQSLPFDNIVFMGMGEPLANYDAVIRAITILNAEWGLKFGARRITISTSGLVPQIYKLADEPVQFRLAVSLHGATNDTRSKIMPINRKYPIEELVPAIRTFSEKHGRMATLEFILIEDVNDSVEEASELAKIARYLHAHVNLIPYNTVEGLPWTRPNLQRQKKFAEILEHSEVSYTIRKEKGQDIDAACGQLRLRMEKEILPE
jgi:23S rRNA (adenine2503-C2)-methyltransferase